MANKNFPETQLHYTKCPKCGKKSLRGKELYEGGGVECMNTKCDYWFCY